MKVTLCAPFITPSQGGDGGENCLAGALLVVLDLGVELEDELDRFLDMDAIPSIDLIVASASNRGVIWKSSLDPISDDCVYADTLAD